jgi:hypothetical protein
MTPNEFDRLTKEIWSPVLQAELGFSFDQGAFFRELPDGTRHVILLDFDVRNAKTFRVMVGFNSALITRDLSPVEAGVFGLRYLDETGFAARPKNLPCFNEDASKASLSKILHVVSEVVVPWFAAHQNAAAVAELVEDQYPFIKGKLLLQAGKLDAAKRCLLRHQHYLNAQPQSAAVTQGLQETSALLNRCT